MRARRARSRPSGVERLTQRAQRLAVTQAISQLNRVDRRLLTLFWHLAERWGRMTPDGVLIPLTLSHRMLSQLVGARRPTVSTALAELAEREAELHELSAERQRRAVELQDLHAEHAREQGERGDGQR